MPTHLRAKCSWQVLDTDPKHTITINPCFRVSDAYGFATGVNAQNLCDDLFNALNTWSQWNTKLKVALYDIQQVPHGPPKAQKVSAEAVPIANPRGVPQAAICLSFYSGQNVPRKRGRLYLQQGLLAAASSENGNFFAQSSHITKAAALVPVLTGLGGVNVDWIVWSSVTNSANKVTDWWVDDSWDVIRSRKLPPLNPRTKGTTSE